MIIETPQLHRAPEGAPSAATTSKRLRAFLKKKNMNMHQAAEMCGIPYGTFYRYCSGDSRPSMATMFKLMKIGVSSHYLYGGRVDFDTNQPVELTEDERFIVKYLSMPDEDRAAIRAFADDPW